MEQPENNGVAFDMISELDLDIFGEMNATEGTETLSKGCLNLFPELMGSSDVSLGLPFEEDEIMELTDNDEEVMSYMTNSRDKTSSIGSMSPRDASDVFEENETVLPPRSGNAKPPVMKVVRIVRLPGKTGAVKLIDNVDARRLQDSRTDNVESQSMSKNAIAARENRQKKKAYVTDLEHSVGKLTSENRGLKTENDKMSKNIASLKTEIRYLKSVLANQSTLSGLLRNIGATPGVQFGSSLCADADDEDEVAAINKKPVKRYCRKRKSAAEDKTLARKENVAHNLRLVESMNQSKKRKADHSYVPNGSVDSSSDSDSDIDVGGVCLHVNKQKVSIEFCSMCSSNSSGSAAEKKEVRR